MQINTVEVGGQNANDLRDQRENLIDELSKMINVEVTERPIGDAGMTEYIVRLDGQLLVDNYETMELEVIPRQKNMSQNDVDGLYDVYWENGERLAIESTSLSGSLKALFEVRDGNNKENLQGFAEEIDKGAKEITITSTNIDNLKDLNIPSEGNITIGNGEYTYSSFRVELNADGSYSYTFELEEEARKNAVKTLEKTLTDNKATITLSKELGQKEFAYEIKKMKSGYYYLYNIETSTDAAINEFDRVAKIDENIVRHLILKIEA